MKLLLIIIAARNRNILIPFMKKYINIATSYGRISNIIAKTGYNLPLFVNMMKKSLGLDGRMLMSTQEGKNLDFVNYIIKKNPDLKYNGFYYFSKY
jgi:hypothetical protein